MLAQVCACVWPDTYLAQEPCEPPYSLTPCGPVWSSVLLVSACARFRPRVQCAACVDALSTQREISVGQRENLAHVSSGSQSRPTPLCVHPPSPVWTHRGVHTGAGLFTLDCRPQYLRQPETCSATVGIKVSAECRRTIHTTTLQCMKRLYTAQVLSFAAPVCGVAYTDGSECCLRTAEEPYSTRCAHPRMALQQWRAQTTAGRARTQRARLHN